MLKTENRLAKHRDFNLLLKRGYWVKGKDVSLKVLNLRENRQNFPKKEDPISFEKQLKLAFSVGLKISKKAVERNRVKRQLREVVRLIFKNEVVRDGFYILIVPNPSIKDRGYAEISDEIKVLFEKAGLLKK